MLHGGRTELLLLMLHEFFFLADIFADLPPVEQRQDSQKVGLRAPTLTAKAKSMFTCRLLPHSAGPHAGPGD